MNSKARCTGTMNSKAKQFLQLSSLFGVSVMFLHFCSGLEIIGVIGFKLVPPMVLNTCRLTNTFMVLAHHIDVRGTQRENIRISE